MSERLPASAVPGGRRSSARFWIACGLFLLVFGIYSLSGPGRIDSVDGEVRFDVAFNWLINGRPIVTDRWLTPALSVTGKDGLPYSYYGAPASVFGIPLVWLGLRTGPPPGIQASQFLFSLTSAVLGAGIAPILFLFYLELGIATRRAFAWTIVSSFATYLWPISTSVLDNAQHAFFAIIAVYFGFLAARRKSAWLAAAGGFMAGILFLYQEYLLLIVPALALSTLSWNADAGELSPAGTKSDFFVQRLVFPVQWTIEKLGAFFREARQHPGEARSSCFRYCAFFAGVSGGVALWLLYNHARFGSWLDSGKLRAAQRGLSPWGNPLRGLLVLLISPGKSIFLYSPVLILGVLGIRELWRRRMQLAAAIGVSTLLLLLFISCIAFEGGDWCWGPRYLAPLLPLWALAFPFAASVKLSRKIVVAIIAIGFVIQALALTVENQRFYFARALDDAFWAEDPWYYFKASALLARPGETLSLFDGVPASARYFNSIPLTEWTTYSLLGTPNGVPRRLSPLWMRNFKIFYLPRPWPLWMKTLSPERRPIHMGMWLAIFLSISGAGAGLIYLGLPRNE